LTPTTDINEMMSALQVRERRSSEA
jgi:hypothetical protein